MKYKPELVNEMVQWVSERGLMDYGGAQLADFLAYFEIGKDAYYDWMEHKPEFSEAIKKAKDKFKESKTREVEMSLMELALGGKEVTKIKEHEEYHPDTDEKDGTKKGKLIKLVRDKETYVTQPNVAAAIFIATNLAPDKWQNRQHNDISVKDDKQQHMTREQMLQEIKALEQLQNMGNEKKKRRHIKANTRAKA